MWMVEELSQMLREMLLEGNIHNIVVFTIITSSSVLSVVGVLRHIYTFVYNLRHGQDVELSPVKEFCTKTDVNSQPFTRMDTYPVVASIERITVANVHPSKQNTRNRLLLKGGNSASKKSNGSTYMKRNKAVWEKHYGLCQVCCQKLGGCQHGYSEQPSDYNPWCSDWHKGETIIDLSHLCLQELPPRLGFHHMDVCSLDVSYNCLTCLPQNVTLMRTLVSLNLRHNLLSNIPAFFRSLHQLSYVDLRNNRLFTFPDSLLELPQLLKLYLDHNLLSKLPYDIDRLYSLQCFSLGYNDLTSIPESLFNIQGLKSLNLRGNSKLSILPNSVGNLICLQRLDVSHCDLRLIPPSLSSCTFLRKCFVSFNRLTHLPCEISQCYRLMQLDVSNNRLTYLPATLIFRQGMLVLAASGNNFLPKHSFTSSWLLLDNITLEGQQRLPSLSSLASAAVDKFNLNLSELPIPVQEDLSSISSCYYCGKKKVISGFRAVKFAYFSQLHPTVPQRHISHEFPFLYTFCQRHLLSCTPDTLETCIDTLSRTHESY